MTTFVQRAEQLGHSPEQLSSNHAITTQIQVPDVDALKHLVEPHVDAATRQQIGKALFGRTPNGSVDENSAEAITSRVNAYLYDQADLSQTDRASIASVFPLGVSATSKQDLVVDSVFDLGTSQPGIVTWNIGTLQLNDGGCLVVSNSALQLTVDKVVRVGNAPAGYGDFNVMGVPGKPGSTGAAGGTGGSGTKGQRGTCTGGGGVAGDDGTSGGTGSPGGDGGPGGRGGDGLPSLAATITITTSITSTTPLTIRTMSGPGGDGGAGGAGGQGGPGGAGGDGRQCACEVTGAGNGGPGGRGGNGGQGGNGGNGANANGDILVQVPGAKKQLISSNFLRQTAKPGHGGSFGLAGPGGTGGSSGDTASCAATHGDSGLQGGAGGAGNPGAWGAAGPNSGQPANITVVPR